MRGQRVDFHCGLIMHAHSVLFLVGLLTLWAELTLISGQSTPQVPDICRLPPEGGPCLALFKHWYYNTRTRRCETFDYGGCQGNANNFKTEEECQRRCAQQAPVTAPAPNNQCPVPLGETQPGQFCATDDSCPGNERCCKTKNGQQCMLPLQERWGYCPKNTTKPGQATICLAKCSNDNNCNAGVERPYKKCCNFGCLRQCAVAEEEHPGVCIKHVVVQTFAPCNNTCKDDRDCPLTKKCCFSGCSLECQDPVRSERCQLPPETGPCKRNEKRFYYNPSQKKCLQFTYGGCQGNNNNFKTKEDCEQACGKISPDVCRLPKDPGPCLGYAPMYYYNSATKKCEIFIYGLCGGNGNRFSSKLECLMVCENQAQSPASP